MRAVAPVSGASRALGLCGLTRPALSFRSRYVEAAGCEPGGSPRHAKLIAEEHEEVHAWRRGHRGHPDQLRHSRATELRRRGLDLAKAVLGRSKVEATQLYDGKDIVAAVARVSRIG